MRASGTDLPRHGKVGSGHRAGRPSRISGTTAVSSSGQRRPTPGQPAQSRRRERLLPPPSLQASPPVTLRTTTASLPAPGAAASGSHRAPRGASFLGPAAPRPDSDRGRDAAGRGGSEQERGGKRGSVSVRPAGVRGRSRKGGQARDRGRFRSGAGGSTSERRHHTLALGVRMCTAPCASSRPPARSPVPARERQDGDLRVRSAWPARVGAERGPHPAPREAAGAGRLRLRIARPGLSYRPGCAGPAASRPEPGGRAGGEWVPGGGGGRRSWAYLCAERRPLRPGPGTGIGGTVAGEGRRGCGGGPCGAEGGRSRSRCLGRAPSGASPALPALAAEGAAGSAPGLDSFTDTTPGRPAPRRDTPAPRRLLPPAGQPASPPLGVTHPGAHTQSRRPSLPLAHTALLTPLSGFVSAHTHVLTQIPSLHTPSLAPFPPHFLEESPYSFRTLLACPTPPSSPSPEPLPQLSCLCAIQRCCHHRHVLQERHPPLPRRRNFAPPALSINARDFSFLESTKAF